MGYLTLIFYLVVLLVSVVLYLAMPKPKPNFNQGTPPPAKDVEVPTVSQSAIIPVVFGSVWLNHPNVVWYGDVGVTPIMKQVCW
jgi:hypothetical protein